MFQVVAFKECQTIEIAPPNRQEIRGLVAQLVVCCIGNSESGTSEEAGRKGDLEGVSDNQGKFITK